MLLTKLHISPPGSQTVHRAELFEKLNLGLKTKLMLVSAPAGFGKTTLVSDWIIQQNIPAVWYSIDNSDNDVAEFLGYIVTAVQGLFPGFGERALKLLHSPQQLSHESIVQLLINELLSFSKHFLLVLDDYHLIQNRDVLNLFSYFVEHLPDTVHLVILTRSDPILPVAKLRSKGQLVELRSADLSFSPHEIDFLFNKKLKLKLSHTDVQSLADKTEGWIAGLQLLALSLRSREDRSSYIREFKGDNRYIMDYLIEEVLKIQSPEIREFLLQTSLLEQLSGPLCDAVLSRTGSQMVLETLEKNNVFIVSLDAERKWYRYHHLFADLLKQRLLLMERSVLMELHKKAGNWFEKNQLFTLAIEHMLHTHDYDKAISLLVETAGSMWQNGLHSSIMKYGNLLPEEVIKKNPGFSLYYAWVLITAGQTQEAIAFLEYAEQITREKMAASQKDGLTFLHERKLLGKIAVAIAYHNSLLGKPEIILKYGQIALENLSEDDPLWFSWGWYVIGMAELANEKIFESTEALKKALGFGKKSGNIYLISTIAIGLGYNEGRLGLYKISYNRSADLLEFLKDNGYVGLARSDWTFAVLYANMAAIQYYWADIEGAFGNIKIAYSLCIKEANITSKVLVLIIYSVLLYTQGDIYGAEMKIKELEANLQKNKVAPVLNSMYIGWKATFLITQKELGKAHFFLEAHDVRPGKTITYAEEYRYIAFSLLLLAENKIEEAYSLLTQLYDMASAQHRIERMIEIKVLLTIIFIASGEKEKARGSLSESLRYAATDEILMYHLNYLDHINPLLQEIFREQAIGKISLPNQFINNLKRTIEKRKNLPGDLGLTPRERDALQLMAENLSNQEIAAKLFISLNTVKSRLKNIFVKLDVDNRNKAVEKAREMRLI